VLGLRQAALEHAHVGGVDVALVRVGDGCRLQVGALHQAHVQPQRQQVGEIVLRPAQIGLEHDADVVDALLAQAPVEGERLRHERALLHVEAQPHAARGGALEQPPGGPK
jgi:hypothetical protein